MDLEQLCSRLKSYVERPLMDQWQIHKDGGFIPAVVNQKSHLAWERGGQAVHFQRSFTLAEPWEGYPIEGMRLYLQVYWWACKAEFFVNQSCVIQGDLFDQRARVLLSDCAAPGLEFHIDAYLESPGHDTGALYNIVLILEHPDEQQDPGFMADELQVIKTLNLGKSKDLLAESIAFLNTIDPLNLSLAFKHVRQILAPLKEAIKELEVNLLGHSHIDMAWLWSHQETLEVSERTFESVLSLQERYPELLFSQSTIYLYDWLALARPQLFEKIQAKIQAGQWEVVGGMWIEPDLNLPDGESLIRHLLYGQHYCLKKFDRVIEVGWNPDSFGYTWQLPQIYKKAGINYFLTQKLLWNDTTPFPHAVFWWEAPNGSRILTYFAPPLGEEIPVVKIAQEFQKNFNQTNYPKILWLYGVGDHGGGPTATMLDTQRRWQRSEFFPKITHHSSEAFFKALEAHIPPLPIWNSELYLEFHRGCYTTHADQKKANRQSEILLTTLEKLNWILSLLDPEQTDLFNTTDLWKKVLFNQFHDILPGTAIPEVFTDANQAWDQIFNQGNEQLAQVLNQIADYLIPYSNRAGNYYLIFNSLNWTRTELIKFLIPQGYQLQDLTGESVEGQRLDDHFYLVSAEVPGLGFSLYRLTRDVTLDALNYLNNQEYILENNYLKVHFDPTTGEIISIWDKILSYELLNAPGNQLQAFHDQGQYWDAWNIDPDYASKPYQPCELIEIKWITAGALRQTIRVVHQIADSVITQEISLDAHEPLIRFKTHIYWQERQVLLKVAFPLTLVSDDLVCEIPLAVINRSTQRETPAQKAQFEVPALRWVAYEAQGRGLALLNDCKYGYDCAGSLLRLTLIKSPIWPDPQSDQGDHEFTYGLYIYNGTWQSAHVIRRGYELNQPLIPMAIKNHTSTIEYKAPTINVSYCSWQAESLILITAKPAEDQDGWILRFYESQGQAVSTDLIFVRPLISAAATDLLERSVQQLAVINNRISVRLTPWEIMTLRVNF